MLNIVNMFVKECNKTCSSEHEHNFFLYWRIKPTLLPFSAIQPEKSSPLTEK